MSGAGLEVRVATGRAGRQLARVLQGGLALSLVAVGCSPEEGGLDGFTPGRPDDPGEPLDTDDPADTGSPDDTGEVPSEPEPTRFALLEVVSTLVDDPTPWSSESGSTLLYAWKRVDLVRDGVDVSWTEAVCGMASTEVFGTTTSYPQAFIEALPVEERRATLSDTVTGASFAMEPQVTVLGARLEDPGADPMPESAGDPEQWDQDGDGHPGVTVHVAQSLLGEGDVYVAQRTFTAYDGVLIDAGRIEGYLEADNEQVVFDASTWWLQLDTNSRDDPEPSHSYFIFQQVEEGTDCPEILDQRDILFR